MASGLARAKKDATNSEDPADLHAEKIAMRQLADNELPHFVGAVKAQTRPAQLRLSDRAVLP